MERPIEVSDPPSKKLKLADEDDVIFTGASTSAEGHSENPPAVQSAGPKGVCPSPLFYLTKVRGASHRFNDSTLAVDIKDILSMRSDLIASVQFNYMFDIAWLVQQYPSDKRKCPLLIVHGDQRNMTAQLNKEAQGYTNIKLFAAKLNDPFGTHHSKMMLLHYEAGLRVVIHTANLIPKDWDQKTQGVWISPLFRKPEPKTSASPSSSSPQELFKGDLIEYLEAYNSPALREWIALLQQHDTTEANVRLVGSVPGSHKERQMSKWGHLKLRKLLSGCGPSAGEGVSEEWPVVGQFSSIGSLGPSPQSWLTSEWLLSLSTCRKGATSTLHKNPSLQLVFPSVDNVRNSLEGYMAGGSIPYGAQTARKQPYLNTFFQLSLAYHSLLLSFSSLPSPFLSRPNSPTFPLPLLSSELPPSPHLPSFLTLPLTSSFLPPLHPTSLPSLTPSLSFSPSLSLSQWKSDGVGRTKAAPHIKTYCRVSKDCKHLAWLLLSSANLSKAAWGATEKKGTQLRIRSYEVGVLFLPSNQMKFFDVPLPGDNHVLPFDLPLTPYNRDDEPWVWDMKYPHPDVYGNVWTPH